MPTIFDLPHFSTSPTALKGQMPKDGDTVIVLRPDGTVDMFALGTYASAAMRKLKQGGSLTAEEIGYVEAASKAFALYFAASNDDVMSRLLDIVNDPAVVDPEALKRMPKIS